MDSSLRAAFLCTAYFYYTSPKISNLSFTDIYNAIPITRTKSQFPFFVKHHIFTHDFLNQFSFSLK